jgi:hypothetical protein
MIGIDATIPTDNVLTLQYLTKLSLVAGYSFKWEGLTGLLTTPSLKSLIITFTSFVIRLKCSRDTALFETHEDIPVPVPGLESFIENLSAATVLDISPWIMPAAIIKQIHNRVLPLLGHGDFSIHLGGLEAFLDLIGSCIQGNPSRAETRFFNLGMSCTDVPRRGGVHDRYRACQEVYAHHNNRLYP